MNNEQQKLQHKIFCTIHVYMNCSVPIWLYRAGIIQIEHCLELAYTVASYSLSITTNNFQCWPVYADQFEMSSVSYMNDYHCKIYFTQFKSHNN